MASYVQPPKEQAYQRAKALLGFGARSACANGLRRDELRCHTTDQAALVSLLIDLIHEEGRRDPTGDESIDLYEALDDAYVIAGKEEKPL